MAGAHPPRDVEPLLRPRAVAVIGASATRRSQGNGVIGNLRLVGYAGRIIPVHPTAPEVDGLPAFAIDQLPPDIDTAVVAIPAPLVAGVLRELQDAGVRSAAISLMNSIAAGLSKVITMGSEWQVTAPDYLRWLAADPATAVVGMVLELIKDPAAFALPAALIRAAGKALVVLKVGRSDVGAAAVRAHTGAMISLADA